MAYNKAKGGGVPIKGNSSTSSIYNPKEGSIDHPQELGGSVMGLGRRLGSELIGNISPGAGTKGGGLHEPIVKEDSVKAVGSRDINPKYNTNRTIIGSSGAVAAGGTKYTSFVASFGAGADIDGMPFPSRDDFDPCDRAANNDKWDYDYLPSGCECCDSLDHGPCKYEYGLPKLGGLLRDTSGIIDPAQWGCVLIDLIAACIDHTKTYSNGDPIVWAEPAALNLLMGTHYEWDHPKNWTWDGSRFTFNNILAGGGLMEINDYNGMTVNDFIINGPWKASNPVVGRERLIEPAGGLLSCTVDYDPNANWSTAIGSDLDKVMKQAVKHYYFDDPMGGGELMKIDMLSQTKWGALGNEIIQILDSSGELTSNDLGPDVSPVRPRWWGGARQNQYFRITIESKEEVLEEQDIGGGITTPIPVGHKFVFKWGHTTDHPCDAQATLSNTVTVNAYKNNGTWVDAPRGSGFDSRGREEFYWTVNLMNNVWAYINPKTVVPIGVDPISGEPSYIMEFLMEIPEYGIVMDSGANLLKCDSDEYKCVCVRRWDAQLNNDCDCWPELYAIPEVINNTNFEDFDSAWPYIREAHEICWIKDSCKCTTQSCRDSGEFR